MNSEDDQIYIKNSKAKLINKIEINELMLSISNQFFKVISSKVQQSELTELAYGQGEVFQKIVSQLKTL